MDWLFIGKFLLECLILSVHRIILTSVLLCSKFFNDIYYSNEQIGQLGGIHPSEMNLLEAYMLDMLDYILFIEEEEYSRYQKGLYLHV